ncbi:tetratricopeptide repeat protein [Marinomonas fungiae]|nr:tetratricopeptide repeat protein [Marinomonas fungiae]
MQKSFNTFILSGLLMASGVTYAEVEQCYVPVSVPSSPTTQQWREINHLLSPQLENCLQSSDYFSLYGASLLYLGDVKMAIEMLERSLLIDPNNGSAQVDYAQALYQSGQLLSALQINAQAIEQASIPPLLKEVLKQRQDLWESQKYLWRNQFSYLYGHSSNLNNATYIDDYELTVLGFDFPVNLSDSYRQKSGNYHYFRLFSQHYSLLTEGVSALSFSAQTRDSNLNKSDTDEFTIAYERNIEKLHFSYHWELEAEHVRLGDEGLYSSFGGSYTLTPRNSISYLRLESSHTHFNSDHTLDDVSFMLEPGILLSDESVRWGANLGLGINSALEDRPGADRNIKQLETFLDLPLLTGRLTTKLSITKTEDNEGYHPWLANNTPRNTKAWAANIQYLYPISKDLTVHASYYYRDQESNIDLFNTKNESIDLGFTYKF